MNLKAQREAAGVTIRELEERTGIARSTLARIEAGDREATGGELALVATALGGAPEPAEAEIEVQGKLDSYPSAPSGKTERKRWLGRRNAALQRVGARPVDGVTFGSGKAPK